MSGTAGARKPKTGVIRDDSSMTDSNKASCFIRLPMAGASEGRVRYGERSVADADPRRAVGCEDGIKDKVANVPDVGGEA